MIEAVLVVALLIETVALAVLCCSLPWLWHRTLRLEARVGRQAGQLRKLDEALGYLLELKGVPEVNHNGDTQLPVPPLTPRQRALEHQRWVSGRGKE